MYRRLIGAALGLGLGALLAATPALAFPAEVDVHVPFAFQVGKVVLPAGDYYVTRVSHAEPGLLMVRSDDGRHAALFDARDATLPVSAAAPRLVFDRYGHHEFLRSVQPSGETDSLGLSHAEVRTAVSAGRR